MAEFITIKAAADICCLLRPEPFENQTGAESAIPSLFAHVGVRPQVSYSGSITGVEITMSIKDVHVVTQKRRFQHAKDVVRAQVNSFSIGAA